MNVCFPSKPRASRRVRHVTLSPFVFSAGSERVGRNFKDKTEYAGGGETVREGHALRPLASRVLHVTIVTLT